jgi:hypothetical protein
VHGTGSLQVVWTGHCDRLFVQVGAWLIHLFMIQVEVLVDVWYILAQVIRTCCYRLITG